MPLVAKANLAQLIPEGLLVSVLLLEQKSDNEDYADRGSHDDDGASGFSVVGLLSHVVSIPGVTYA